MAETRFRLDERPTRTAAVTAIVAVAAFVLVWGIVAEDSDFRPTAPAAIVTALMVAVAAHASPVRLAVVLTTASLLGAIVLLLLPAGERCDSPIAEFASHVLEDAAEPHEHDHCQLESDRRSLTGLAVAGGGGTAVMLLVRRHGALKGKRSAG